MLEKATTRHVTDAAFAGLLVLLMFALSGHIGVAPFAAVAFSSVVFVWRSLFSDPLSDPLAAPVWLLLPVAASVLVHVARPFPGPFQIVPTALIALAIGVLTVATRRQASTAMRISLVAIVVGATIVTAVGIAVTTDPTRIDIYVAQEGAAKLLEDGRNPYTDLVFDNSSPWAEDGAVFEGYPYPAVPLIVFSIGEWTVGANVLGAMLLAATVFVLSWPLVRTSFAAGGVMAGALLLASPAFWFMSFSSATESLSALLFAASGVWWKRRPMLAAALFGVAVASKQYLLIPGLAIVLVASDDRWHRTLVAGGAALAVSIPFLVWDPAAYLRVYLAGFDQPLRHDAISLGALGVELPAYVVAAAAIVAMYLVATRIGGGSGVFWTASVGLAVALAITPHSLINHWFLLTALIATAIVTGWLNADQADDLAKTGNRGSASTARDS